MVVDTSSSPNPVRITFAIICFAISLGPCLAEERPLKEIDSRERAVEILDRLEGTWTEHELLDGEVKPTGRTYHFLRSAPDVVYLEIRKTREKGYALLILVWSHTRNELERIDYGGVPYRSSNPIPSPRTCFELVSDGIVWRSLSRKSLRWEFKGAEDAIYIQSINPEDFDTLIGKPLDPMSKLVKLKPLRTDVRDLKGGAK